MADKIKIGSRVVWNPSSSSVGWTGVVTAINKSQCYVLFDGGGHWLSIDEVELQPSTKEKTS